MSYQRLIKVPLNDAKVFSLRKYGSGAFWIRGRFVPETREFICRNVKNGRIKSIWAGTAVYVMP